MQKPSIGRIVHYRLSARDAESIRDQREKRTGDRHTLNPVVEGEVLPLIIVRVWPDEYGPGVPGVNGQVVLDGRDTHWVTSVKEGSENGTWFWPPFIPPAK